MKTGNFTLCKPDKTHRHITYVLNAKTNFKIIILCTFIQSPRQIRRLTRFECRHLAISLITNLFVTAYSMKI